MPFPPQPPARPSGPPKPSAAHGAADGSAPEVAALSTELEAEMARLKPEEQGERIGRYKLLQEIGEGGFGTVWLAEQMEPVSRKVALKIIKLGMDTREVIARFEVERQALAMMDHPNIAKVLDAGATQYGRPFFVMELVKGLPITKYCDDAGLGTKERLELFGDVCSAINHAHQKGVIHRDIKPSNVMITLHGDKAVVKVIDFGIAKATQGRLTDKTLFTRFEQFIGTPVYMSPEQANLSGLDVDTRSDIYALGILLYELLTGKPPFDPSTLAAAGYEEMRRIIREVEPPKPSLRLSTTVGDERSVIAKARHIEPEKLNRLVEPDLDWIVMKAIEKDRSRRYETANGLAADIRRFLADEPVTARPPSARYQFQKFARRNKAALRVAAGLAAVLLAATAVSSWLAVRATRAEARATAEAERATRERDAKELARRDAEDISKFLDEVFRSSGSTGDGRVVTVTETLDNAARKLETELADQPVQRAKLQATLGSTFLALGFTPQAIALLEQVRDYRLATSGLDDPETFRAMNMLANAYSAAGRKEEALKLKEKVLALALKKDPNSRATADAYAQMGFFLDANSRNLEAMTAWQEAVRINPEAANVHYWLSRVLVDYGRYVEALPSLRATQRLYPDKLRGFEATERIAFAEAMLEIANSKAGTPNRPSVSELLKVWIAARRQTVAADPTDTERAKLLASIHLWLGQTAEHQAICRKQLELAADSKDPSTHDRAAKAYLLQAHPDPELLQLAVASARQALKLASADHAHRVWFTVTAGLAAFRDGQPAEAERLLTEAMDLSSDHRERQCLALAFRAMARTRLGRTAEAQADFDTMEKMVLPLPAREPLSPIVLSAEKLAAGLAYEEAKALLSQTAKTEAR